MVTREVTLYKLKNQFVFLCSSPSYSIMSM